MATYLENYNQLKAINFQFQSHRVPTWIFQKFVPSIEISREETPKNINYLTIWICLEI
jgi:hypothetical protein